MKSGYREDICFSSDNPTTQGREFDEFVLDKLRQQVVRLVRRWVTVDNRCVTVGNGYLLPSSRSHSTAHYLVAMSIISILPSCLAVRPISLFVSPSTLSHFTSRRPLYHLLTISATSHLASRRPPHYLFTIPATSHFASCRTFHFSSCRPPHLLLTTPATSHFASRIRLTFCSLYFTRLLPLSQSAVLSLSTSLAHLSPHFCSNFFSINRESSPQHFQKWPRSQLNQQLHGTLQNLYAERGRVATSLSWISSRHFKSQKTHIMRSEVRVYGNLTSMRIMHALKLTYERYGVARLEARRGKR